MPLTYAIADLHGRFDLLVKAYELIADHASDMGGGGTIVHLGDYVDRGPQSQQIIEFLMNPMTIPSGFKRAVLKGNHEEIMWETCKGLHPGWWLSNGGGHTLLSYGHATKGTVDTSCVPQGHLDWIEKLPFLHIDQHRVFVHAYVSRNTDLDSQNPELMTWTLYPDGDEGGHGDRHVVHGHHQFADGPKFFKRRTDLDTFAWYTGHLAIGVFDDDVAGGPTEILHVEGNPATLNR